MIILGLNAYHGDSSACIVADGRLVATVEGNSRQCLSLHIDKAQHQSIIVMIWNYQGVHSYTLSIRLDEWVHSRFVNNLRIT